MLTPKEREKYFAMYTEADRLLAAEMRGKVVLTPKAEKLRRRRDEAESILRDDDREGEARIRHAALPRDYIIRIVAIPILADILDDMVCEIDDTLHKAGVAQSVFGEMVRNIHRSCYAITDRLLAAADMGCQYLADLAINDETITAAVKKKIYSYVGQRIKSQEQ